MEERTKGRINNVAKRTGNVALGGVYGAVASAGFGYLYFWVDETASAVTGQRPQSQRLDDVIELARATADSESSPSRDQVAQIHAEVSELDGLFYRNEITAQLDDINHQLMFIKTAYDPQNHPQQTQLRTALADISDQLTWIKDNEKHFILDTAPTGIVLGGAILLGFGYSMIRRFYRAIRPKK